MWGSPRDLGEGTVVSSRETEGCGKGGGGEVQQGEKKLGGQGGHRKGRGWVPKPPPGQSQPEWLADECEGAVPRQGPEVPPPPPLCFALSPLSSPCPALVNALEKQHPE